MKIITIEIDNFKRLRAVNMELSAEGLNIIGGKNAQGKTSVLDAIAWALGGNNKAPSAARNDPMRDPYIKIELDNGLVVERKGKNSSLHVSDSKGMRGGQTLLNEFLCEFALDLPKFMEAKPKEKAEILLRTLGVEEKLAAIEEQYEETFQERAYQNRAVKTAQGKIEGMPLHSDVEGPVDVQALREEFNKVELANKAIIEKRNDLTRAQASVRRYNEEIEEMENRLARLKGERKLWQDQLVALEALSYETTDTSEIISKIAKANDNNRKHEDNLRYKAAQEELVGLVEKAEQLSKFLNTLKGQKQDLLDGAKLPLPGLEIIDGEIAYKGAKWDCMSGAEQLMVSASIARAINPQCRFVLMDKLEQMDTDTLGEFGHWAAGQGLQIIATRVSVGDECSFIIEDGQLLQAEESEVEA